MKTNYHKHPVATMAAFALGITAAPAVTTLFETNLQSHGAGAATAASLSAVTTGGQWFLNTARGATQTIEVDAAGSSAGDKALLFDDPDTTGNDGTINFGSVFISGDTTFTTNAVTLTTSTGLRRTGADKTYTYQFEGTGSTVGATITWSGDNTVSFNGGPTVSLGGLFMGAWDADSANVMDISAVFSGSNVTLTWGALSSGSIPVLNGVTDLKNLRFASGGTAGTQRGIFIDEILVTQVPEPSASLLGGLCALLLLRRRR